MKKMKLDPNHFNPKIHNHQSNQPTNHPSKLTWSSIHHQCVHPALYTRNHRHTLGEAWPPEGLWRLPCCSEMDDFLLIDNFAPLLQPKGRCHWAHKSLHERAEGISKLKLKWPTRRFRRNFKQWCPPQQWQLDNRNIPQGQVRWWASWLANSSKLEEGRSLSIGKVKKLSKIKINLVKIKNSLLVRCYLLLPWQADKIWDKYEG